MKINLAAYSGKKICVAVSGGRDSMALLCYFSEHAREYSITLSALNCDHKIRGEISARDSAFVTQWCKASDIPLLSFEWNTTVSRTEGAARAFRLECYKTAMLPSSEWDNVSVLPKAYPQVWAGADAIATAHHMDDNAETVLFNLARGSGLAGLRGITDVVDRDSIVIVHPLVAVSRDEIDAYVAANSIKYVDDATNFTDDYTRNKIRHNVLPALESAVHGATAAIYRFSRLAAEDEDYFSELIKERKLIRQTPYGVEIKFCKERAVFKRAALGALGLFGDVRDYTFEHAERLYNLQLADRGKRFEFLGFVAYCEDGKIVICRKSLLSSETDAVPFIEYIGKNNDIFGGQRLIVASEKEACAALDGEKLLKFDIGSVPDGAAIRFMRAGDRFEKFGGGAKKLGDYFTDKKIPVRLRGLIPLITKGGDVLAVCGVEIADSLKITSKTKKTGCIICTDFTKL